MTEETPAIPNNNRKSAVDKLREQRKARQDKVGTVSLPISQLEATYPLTIMHQDVKKANRMAKGKNDDERAMNAQVILMTNLCRFDGDRLTALEFSELLDMSDINALTDAMFETRTADDIAEMGDSARPKRS